MSKDYRKGKRWGFAIFRKNVELYGKVGVAKSEKASMTCDKIVNLTIPEAVTSIGDYSFFGCGGLANVILLSTTPPTLGGGYTFDSTACTITVPKGCGASYKAAQYWSEYADRIVEAS